MTLEITSLATMRATVHQWRAAGERIALVPTMGALHAGHLALVKHAQTLADRVIVSIFVNPAQFGPNEDFARYPRPLADDLAALRSVGADAAWLPEVATMYPQGFTTTIHVAGVSEGLCGTSRPGHFDGVATVVAKLFLQVQPDIALFGEKDYQQLCVIKRLVNDLNLNIKVVGVPTIREADGLALSSRNRYLSADERAIAPHLQAVLQETAEAIRIGIPVAAALARGIETLRARGFARVDYLELRGEDSLASQESYTPPARLLCAAWLGTTRLIDNLKL